MSLRSPEESAAIGRRWSQTLTSFLLCFLLAFPHRQRAPIAWLAGKVRGPGGADSAETRFERVAVQLVDAELLFPFGKALGHFIVDGFGLLRRVDGNLRLEEDLACHGRSDLVPFADSFHLLEHFRWHRLAVCGTGHHRPLALQLGQIFLDRFILFGQCRRNPHCHHSDQECDSNCFHSVVTNYGEALSTSRSAAIFMVSTLKGVLTLRKINKLYKPLR